MRPLRPPLGIALLVPWGAPKAVAETEDAPLVSHAAIQFVLRAPRSGPR